MELWRGKFEGVETYWGEICGVAKQTGAEKFSRFLVDSTYT